MPKRHLQSKGGAETRNLSHTFRSSSLLQRQRIVMLLASPSRVPNLRKLDVGLSRQTHEYSRAIFDTLVHAEKLEVLAVRIDSYSTSINDAAQKFCHIAHNWLDAVERTERERTAAMDILQFPEVYFWDNLGMLNCLNESERRGHREASSALKVHQLRRRIATSEECPCVNAHCTTANSGYSTVCPLPHTY
ncbi:hypothetical protein BU23DRAFT_595668 [Bimuria novae-zelandiae CBS 107.79]|uniref:Uncharacterized protein n=1 Tax=Bimuria novae-zelandiae CBS 107.79 TaxID=1447943 RepID=A0A6A5VML0_9PLEO|nr:hypothetical protein BU23DRAFT_595668 [Bimuria novae-zelandiae CBS 107.79]